MKKFQNIPAKVNAPNPTRPRMPAATVAAAVAATVWYTTGDERSQVSGPYWLTGR